MSDLRESERPREWLASLTPQGTSMTIIQSLFRTILKFQCSRPKTNCTTPTMIPVLLAFPKQMAPCQGLES